MKLPYEDIDLDLEKVSNFNTLGDKIIIKSFTKEHLLINKKLKLCPAVLRCLYLTLGDGSLQKGVYLSNINYRAHKEFIEIFNSYFNINKKDFVISLTVNEKTNGRNINKSKKYWLNSLKIQRIDRFYFTKFNTC
ncbi:hypothetical protein HYT58_02330, partial [Candidatus Woesearchaeota archaeon]|nr:hypothetical protein [Candidatus Woesearchaeota archaeon]